MPHKKYYDLVTYLVTQLTFSFVTTPFLVLGFKDSLLVWSRVYFYAVFWAVASLAFFVSPGKVMLKKRLEEKKGSASATIVRSLSTDSLNDPEPILGISKDLELDVADVMEVIKAEKQARQKQAAEKKKLK